MSKEETYTKMINNEKKVTFFHFYIRKWAWKKKAGFPKKLKKTYLKINKNKINSKIKIKLIPYFLS